MALPGPAQDAHHELPGADATCVVDHRVRVKPLLSRMGSASGTWIWTALPCGWSRFSSMGMGGLLSNGDMRSRSTVWLLRITLMRR